MSEQSIVVESSYCWPEVRELWPFQGKNYVAGMRYYVVGYGMVPIAVR